MPIRYFVKQLLLPPGILLVILVLAWWLRRSRPRLAGALFAVGIGGFWLMSLPVVVQWSARALEREPALAQSEWSSLATRADAIASKRNEILELIRQGAQATRRAEAAQEEEPKEDFVEEQGGLY